MLPCMPPLTASQGWLVMATRVAVLTGAEPSSASAVPRARATTVVDTIDAIAAHV